MSALVWLLAHWHPLLITALGARVALRVLCVLAKARRDVTQCHFRFQGFAAGYALLGAMTLQSVVDAWRGDASLTGLGLVAASFLLITFDRRKR